MENVAGLPKPIGMEQAQVGGLAQWLRKRSRRDVVECCEAAPPPAIPIIITPEVEHLAHELGRTLDAILKEVDDIEKGRIPFPPARGIDFEQYFEEIRPIPEVFTFTVASVVNILNDLCQAAYWSRLEPADMNEKLKLLAEHVRTIKEAWVSSRTMRPPAAYASSHEEFIEFTHWAILSVCSFLKAGQEGLQQQVDTAKTGKEVTKVVTIAYSFSDLSSRVERMSEEFQREAKEVTRMQETGELDQLRKALEPPLSLSMYVGQEVIRHDLRLRIDRARMHAGAVPHLLLCGPREMGKATLAHAIAVEMDVGIRQCHSAAIEREGDLATILTELRGEDILLIEEIESLPRPVVSTLASAIGDYALDIVIGKGLSAREIRLQLPWFTIIGTTSRPSQVDNRLHRWMIVYDLAPYDVREISEIIQLLAKQERVTIEPDAAHLLAEYCDGRPGNARALTKTCTV
ncbi:MAG: AAA family ATPase [Anaerolineales bacterium]|nr:AAA family ATPase [Anaerolineales bacterium]